MCGISYQHCKHEHLQKQCRFLRSYRQHSKLSSDSSFEEIYQGVVSFLKSNPNIDVIIAPGFQTATDAIIAAVNHLGLSIPNDIKLMIFDNDFSSTELKLIKPYAIEQDAYQIGYRSAAALYNQLYGDLRTETIRLPVNIIDYTEMQSIERQLT